MSEIPNGEVVPAQAGPGPLSDSQESSFTTLKENLMKKGICTPSTKSPSPSDDVTLLRFLRARRYNSAAAEKQFSEAMAWRKKHDVDKLFATFDTPEMERGKMFYPRWTGRRDLQGLPVYVYRLSSLDKIEKELHSIPTQRRYQLIISLHELMVNFVMPLCSYLPHKTSPAPISSVTSIIDLGGVSLSSLWTFRSHLQQASTLATANYPETLNMIVVVNSPSYFPTVWGWIKNWFDEGTRKKIHVLGKDPGSTLRSLVDPANLPKCYGGELDWDFQDDPNLDAPIRDLIGETMPKGPVVFSDGAVVKPTVDNK